MPSLIFNNSTEIVSFFQLLGNNENDITKAISWVLKECPEVLCLLIKEKCNITIKPEDVVIYYQSFEIREDRRTFTDIEITDYKTFAVIVEAKRGWILPSSIQLDNYSKKESFLNNPAAIKKIFTLSECSDEYAKKNLPFNTTDNGIPIEHVSWDCLKDILKSARKKASHKNKNLIDEFNNYLGGLMSMSNSNSVYVVSLSYSYASNGHTYVDVVNESGHYFCPIKWFKNTANLPNYIAFRYKGKLQSIHHIDSYVITKNMHDEIDFMPDEEWNEEHYIFNLGPAIIPTHDVTCGPSVRRSNRVYADIDTLLTADTITDAMEISKSRR